MAWFFYEIATRPEAQERIRQEIAAVRARSDDEFTAADLDSMAYTQAALKVHSSFFQGLLLTRRFRNVGGDAAPPHLLAAREGSDC